LGDRARDSRRRRRGRSGKPLRPRPRRGAHDELVVFEQADDRAVGGEQPRSLARNLLDHLERIEARREQRADSREVL
jgi:hypothetical protein